MEAHNIITICVACFAFSRFVKIPFEMLIVLPLFALTAFFGFVSLLSGAVDVVPPWWGPGAELGANLFWASGTWFLSRIVFS
jgi:hypothetical protein